MKTKKDTGISFRTTEECVANFRELCEGLETSQASLFEELVGVLHDEFKAGRISKDIRTFNISQPSLRYPEHQEVPTLAVAEKAQPDFDDVETAELLRAALERIEGENPAQDIRYGQPESDASKKSESA